MYAKTTFLTILLRLLITFNSYTGLIVTNRAAEITCIILKVFAKNVFITFMPFRNQRWSSHALFSEYSMNAMDWKCKNINTKLRLDNVLMAYQHLMLVAIKLIMKMVYTCYSDLCYVAYMHMAMLAMLLKNL